MNFKRAMKITGWTPKELRENMEKQWANPCAKPLYKAAWFIGAEPYSEKYGLGVKKNGGAANWDGSPPPLESGS